MSRFDYVRYDESAFALQADFKHSVETLERHIEHGLKSPRAKALALTKLEEVYMWIGKAIRDDQLGRTFSDQLQEERSNS
jgi:hypothetical protein